MINAKSSTQDELMYVHLERGITSLAVDQEIKMTALKSTPDNELKLQDEASQPLGEEKSSDHIKRAIEDFRAAIEISKQPRQQQSGN